ncbi:hypothetical protein JCM10207_008591 [Rhodosporidiobolus poonsookiae]
MGGDDSFGLPSYNQAQYGQPPLEYHVYRDASFFSKDDVVTGPDKQNVLYYLDFPRKFLSNSWDLTLKRGGPQGPQACQIIKGHFGDSFNITTHGQTRCQRVGFFRPRYQFGGNGNTELYEWRPDGHFIHQKDYSLYKETELNLPEAQRKVIAHWRTPWSTFTKDGTLLIHPEHAYEQELILATALGIEERARERRERNR